MIFFQLEKNQQNTNFSWIFPSFHGISKPHIPNFQQVAGIREQEAYDAVREPLLLMGVYFQAQDDYLDAFAPPETLGKIGTDIQEGRNMTHAKLGVGRHATKTSHGDELGCWGWCMMVYNS